MKKKAKSTYKEFIEDDEQKALLDKEYKETIDTLSRILDAVGYQIIFAPKNEPEIGLKLA